MEQQSIQETVWLEMDSFKTSLFLLKKIEKLLLMEQYQNQDHKNHSLLFEQTQNYIIYKENQILN